MDEAYQQVLDTIEQKQRVVAIEAHPATAHDAVADILELEKVRSRLIRAKRAMYRAIEEADHTAHSI